PRPIQLLLQNKLNLEQECPHKKILKKHIRLGPTQGHLPEAPPLYLRIHPAVQASYPHVFPTPPAAYSASLNRIQYWFAGEFHRWQGLPKTGFLLIRVYFLPTLLLWLRH